MWIPLDKHFLKHKNTPLKDCSTSSQKWQNLLRNETLIKTKYIFYATDRKPVPASPLIFFFTHTNILSWIRPWYIYKYIYIYPQISSFLCFWGFSMNAYQVKGIYNIFFLCFFTLLAVKVSIRTYTDKKNMSMMQNLSYAPICQICSIW